MNEMRKFADNFNNLGIENTSKSFGDSGNEINKSEGVKCNAGYNIIFAKKGAAD
jgi:hypothetical protein